VIGTHQLRKDLYLLAAASNGRDDHGSTRRLSLQAESMVSHQLAITGRLEVLGGRTNDVAPVLSATYYPYEKPWMWLRLTGEIVERKGQRSFAFLARVLF
jgi:hypothetical protein